MKEKIKVLVFAAHYLPGYKGGGPIKTIKNLVDSVGNQVSFQIVTSDRDLGDRLPYDEVVCGDWNDLGGTQVFYMRPGFLGLSALYRILRSTDCDLVYLNSFFSVRFSVLPLLVARLFGRRVILGPRGEFSTGALALKASKKRLFIKLYKLLGLHKGVVFQASSPFEARDINRALGENVDIKVAENIGAHSFAREIEETRNGRLRAVFLSRISPKKNLLGALEILGKVKIPLDYDIFGPIEDERYWSDCRKIVESLPDNVRVRHMGELHPNDVIRTLEGYDVFFFPTKGENYGHVIAEALCAGLPVLLADTTPWRDLEEKGLGWDLPLNEPERFAEALGYLSSLSNDDLIRMRSGILAWSKNKFSQRDAVNANIAMFSYACQKK